MVNFIKQHIIGSIVVEHAQHLEGVPWFDCWWAPDRRGRIYFLRVGGMTLLWSTPGALRRAA